MKPGIKIVDISATIAQESDCCAPGQDPENYMKIKIEDGGGGPYVSFSTQRWAINVDDMKDIEELYNKMKIICDLQEPWV